ncbi:ferredoxin reductase [Nocardioides marmoriginsengisoli]|uniref:Ferredoxin reductase n=1 Tax=Nocardioides marmoriginsengisoli TaxID=661483 RepID=A0A3N0CP75_9ACTN|nr:ferredoxin reductase [Nocardioides marmoriginsengisoli]RNL65277.1 ferredoxin reductase [Nocardioides marmoriginsengisoli]
MTLTSKVLGSRAVAALTSPHGVDRYLEMFHPMWAAIEVRARVVDIHRENPDAHGSAPVATLTLQPTSTWRGHRAGQYVQVGVEMPGSARRMTRCFSISSAASLPGERITLTIRANDEGTGGGHSVSTFLVNEAKVGQMLHLSQAEGDFTLPFTPTTGGPDPVLMISGGSGITPGMAQLRTLLRDAPRMGSSGGRTNRKVTFVHFARSPEDQIFADELAAIAAADNNIDVHLRYGDQTFSEFELRRLVPDFRNTDTWACGPSGLIELVRAAYGEVATPEGSGATDCPNPRLRVEFFKPPALTTGAAGGEVSFTRSGATGENTGATLLDQAEALGLNPESGCRMGICFSCVKTKTDGTVRNVLTGEESSLPDEEIRICVSAPVGDCSVDL